jgi:hypothetical protein
MFVSQVGSIPVTLYSAPEDEIGNHPKVNLTLRAVDNQLFRANTI